MKTNKAFKGVMLSRYEMAGRMPNAIRFKDSAPGVPLRGQDRPLRQALAQAGCHGWLGQLVQAGDPECVRQAPHPVRRLPFPQIYRQANEAQRWLASFAHQRLWLEKRSRVIPIPI
jgi:hypothetical protein